MRHTPSAVFAALMLSAGLLAPVSTSIHAQARASSSELETKARELQGQVQASSESWKRANEHLTQLQEEIAQNTERIADIEARLPLAKQKAEDSMRSMYKMRQSQGDLVHFLLASENFNKVISVLTYLNSIEDKNATSLSDLKTLKAELDSTKEQLETQGKEAIETEHAAKTAMNEAIAARVAAQKAAEEQAAREAAEAAAAIEEARKREGESFTTETGQVVKVEAPAANAATEAVEATPAQQGNSTHTTSDGPTATGPVKPNKQGQVEWGDRASFVKKWAPRIDAYLAGSPLADKGKVFAEASWDYGVDPRWSPAIATIESSTGRYCFKPHNAWGWGRSSWPDWDTAIREHVEGLSIGYGYTLTLAGARKYCPPTYTLWYSSVLRQMESI